jgi:hypothetical protein
MTFPLQLHTKQWSWNTMDQNKSLPKVGAAAGDEAMSA